MIFTVRVDYSCRGGIWTQPDGRCLGRASARSILPVHHPLMAVASRIRNSPRRASRIENAIAQRSRRSFVRIRSACRSFIVARSSSHSARARSGSERRARRDVSSIRSISWRSCRQAAASPGGPRLSSMIVRSSPRSSRSDWAISHVLRRGRGPAIMTALRWRSVRCDRGARAAGATGEARAAPLPGQSADGSAACRRRRDGGRSRRGKRRRVRRS